MTKTIPDKQSAARAKAFREVFRDGQGTRIGITCGKLRYFIAFCPRYRRCIFEIDGVKDMVRESVKLCAQSMNLDIISVNFLPDCVYMTLDAPPEISAGEIQATIKMTATQLILRENPPEELAQAKTIWTRNYFVSSENIDDKFTPKERALGYTERQPKRAL